MKVIAIGRPDVSEALATAESLRKDIESGKIKAFAAVGIQPDHETRIWCASAIKTTRLEMIGAMHHLLHCYECGEADE